MISCVAIGSHARGESHDDALALLARAPDSASLVRALGTLLAAKTRVGYGWESISRDRQRQIARAAARLVQAAEDRYALRDRT